MVVLIFLSLFKKVLLIVIEKTANRQIEIERVLKFINLKKARGVNEIVCF